MFKDGMLTSTEYAVTKQRLLAGPSLYEAALEPPALKTFGTGWSASVFNGTEQTIFTHAVPRGAVSLCRR